MTKGKSKLISQLKGLEKGMQHRLLVWPSPAYPPLGASTVAPSVTTAPVSLKQLACRGGHAEGTVQEGSQLRNLPHPPDPLSHELSLIFCYSQPKIL